MSVTLYHNPRCTKSRETLSLLTARGIEPEVILYLVTPPDAAALRTLLHKLNFTSARQLMRTKDPLFTALSLDDASLSEAQLLQTLADNPSLIERPVVVKGEYARLGRPPENVLEIL